MPTPDEIADARAANRAAEPLEAPRRLEAPAPVPMALELAAAPPAPTYRELGYWFALARGEDPSSAGPGWALSHYYAHALDLPVTAARHLSWIGGNLFVGAQLLRALAEQRGYRVTAEDWTDQACTAVLWHHGAEVGRYTYTLEDAQRAGLIRDRSGWVKSPRRMLWARASKYVIDDFAPGVSLGLYVEEEADEIVPPPGGYDFTGEHDPEPADPGYVEDPDIPF